MHFCARIMKCHLLSHRQLHISFLKWLFYVFFFPFKVAISRQNISNHLIIPLNQWFLIQVLGLPRCCNDKSWSKSNSNSPKDRVSINSWEPISLDKSNTPDLVQYCKREIQFLINKSSIIGHILQNKHNREALEFKSRNLIP